MKLWQLLDCPRTPTLEQARGWLGELHALSSGRALSPAQLKTAGVLADLAALQVIRHGSGALETAPNEGRRPPLLLPDAHGRLVPSHTLLVDDAPWLEGRVDKSAAGHLPIVHSSVYSSTARRLGARGLSTAVIEVNANCLPFKCVWKPFDHS